MVNVLHFIFGINMEIKYSYSLPLTEGTVTLNYNEFLDYIGGEDFTGEDFTVEELKEAIRTIAIEDLESTYGNSCPEFDITINNEFVKELMIKINSKREAQDDAVEAIKKILENFDYETQNRILNMV